MSQHMYPPPLPGPGNRSHQPQPHPPLSAHHPPQHVTQQLQHRHPLQPPHSPQTLPVPQHAPHGTHLQHTAEQHSTQHVHATPLPAQSVSSHQTRFGSILRTDIRSSSVTSTVQNAGNSEPLDPISRTDEASRRRLEVVQQPKRARMCGFGDKDRRPITPPPCVRLVITDPDTGKEIDYNEIDCTMFVLNVDLWNGNGTQELNHVRANDKSGSTSSSGAGTVYSELNSTESGPASYPVHAGPRDQEYLPPAVGYTADYHTHGPGYIQGTSSYQAGQYPTMQPYYPQHPLYRHEAAPTYGQGRSGSYGRYNQGLPGPYLTEPNSTGRNRGSSDQPTGMFTRNLIGSLAASAFRLNDTEGRVGIWFVLQDLSVRTEGPCRLRFSFVDVGSKSTMQGDYLSQKINTGRAPIMAACFTETFTVFSAKKFPGVCESTALSKTFAAQGIKIPVRKDATSRGEDDEEIGD